MGRKKLPIKMDDSITVRVLPNERAAIEQAAKEEKTTLSGILRNAVIEYLAKRKG